MKVAAAPSLHEEMELQQVPLTRAHQKNLQAPEDVASRQLSPVARAKLLHASANNLDTGHAGHDRPGHGSPGPVLDRIASEVASILELEGKETLTINEIRFGAGLA